MYVEISNTCNNEKRKYKSIQTTNTKFPKLLTQSVLKAFGPKLDHFPFSYSLPYTSYDQRSVPYILF